MKPYYETQDIKLYHGNCLEIMPEFQNREFDLVLTDPPYGIGEAAGKNKSRGNITVAKDYGNKDWDNSPPPPEAFEQMRRISLHQIIFGGNYFVEWLRNSSCWLVWDKDNGGNDFADCELAYTSFKSAIRKIRYRWNGMLKEVPEKRFHPTQKPVGLFRQILTTYTEPHYFICDPFAGSGTTAIACEQLGLRCVCIESDEEYCEVASLRIENEAKQLKLFNEVRDEEKGFG